MANSASDARSSELEIRRKLIEARPSTSIVAVGPNIFYTVTLPCTLWFLDRGKAGTDRATKTLFLDARHVYRQIDRAHRDWTEAQIGFLANVVRLYRGEQIDLTLGGDEAGARLKSVFGEQPAYCDVLGLCRVVSLAELGEKNWSLNPAVYVGVAPGDGLSDEDFAEKFEILNEEFVVLSKRAAELYETIEANAAAILNEVSGS